MSESEIIQSLKGLSIEERISLIEAILQTLKQDAQKEAIQPNEPPDSLQRPAFGFMKHTGQILGDVINPIVSEAEWNVLQGK